MKEWYSYNLIIYKSQIIYLQFIVRSLDYVSKYNTVAGQLLQATSRTVDDLKETNTILVKNVPVSVDEELLEIFFESTKKQGGGPVKSVKILSDKKVAFVEFYEHTGVETVLKQKPIKYGKTELDTSMTGWSGKKLNKTTSL